VKPTEDREQWFEGVQLPLAGCPGTTGGVSRYPWWGVQLPLAGCPAPTGGVSSSHWSEGLRERGPTLKPMEDRGQWFQDPREIGVQNPELGCIDRGGPRWWRYAPHPAGGCPPRAT